MANFKYFSGSAQLTNVYYDGRKAYGRPEGVTPVWTAEKGWRGQDVRADRVIEYKSNPSKHKCDARCTNAKGFKCECECGGKNHGAGNFICEAA
jgi:hypothetical protein